MQIYSFDASKTAKQIRIQPVDNTTLNTRGNKWCCAVCGSGVANDCDKAIVDGRNEHVKTNPQGHTFLIRCFHTAECQKLGEATYEHSWFMGYMWRYAHCCACHSQLGWHFSGSSSFYGLIKEQIRICE